MRDPLSRIPDSNASAVSKASDLLESPQHEMSPSEDLLKLVVNNAADYRSVGGGMVELKPSTPLDRLARERVFDSIIRKTLENPTHPYYVAGAETRRKMIQEIAAVLNPSHYLTSSKKQNKRQA